MNIILVLFFFWKLNWKFFEDLLFLRRVNFVYYVSWRNYFFRRGIWLFCGIGINMWLALYFWNGKCFFISLIFKNWILYFHLLLQFLAFNGLLLFDGKNWIKMPIIAILNSFILNFRLFCLIRVNSCLIDFIVNI